MPQKDDYKYYNEGNAARDIEREEAEETARRSEERKKAIEYRKTRRNRINDRKKATVMKKGAAVLYLSGAIIVAFCAAWMINLQSSITINNRKIAALESSLSKLKVENDSRYREITTSVDLESIRIRATEELGMHYPTEDQICYYTVDQSNYLEEYGSIGQ